MHARITHKFIEQPDQSVDNSMAVPPRSQRNRSSNNPQKQSRNNEEVDFS